MLSPSSSFYGTMSQPLLVPYISDSSATPEEMAKERTQRFPLKASGMAAHPADSTGSLANWSTLYGVIVGPRKFPFVIHKHVVRKITFLRERLLDSLDSTESKTGLLELLEVDTMAFAVAIDFAYNGRLDDERIEQQYACEDEEESGDEPEDDIIVVDASSISKTATPEKPSKSTAEDTKEDEKPEDEDIVRPPYDNLLVTVFELAQALQYEELANAAIDSYCKALAEDPPSAWGLLYLQRKGLQHSKLMKLMLRAIAWCIKSEGYEAWEDQDFMKGFVKASTANSGMVMKAMADHHDETSPFEGGIEACEYHEHVMTARCPKKRGSVGKEGKAKKQKRA